MYHYIFSYPINVLKSCLCFDPSAPVDSRISRIADMNYGRWEHSLIVANEKLYAIGGWAEILNILIRNVFLFRFQNAENRSDGLYWPINFCNAIEEYDPQTDKWKIVREVN